MGLVLAVGIAACGTTPSQEIRSDAPEVEDDGVAARRTTGALNAFAIDLEQQLAADGGNVVVASYPVGVSLAMARAGSYDLTRQQLDAVLHVGPGVDLDAGIATLSRRLTAREGQQQSEKRKGDIELWMSSTLWVQQGLTFPATFLETLSANYDAGVRLVDFRSDPESARRSVNDWIEDEAGGQITELIDRGMLRDYTRFVLTSASYPTAPWLVRFDPALTRPVPFRRLDGSTVGAPTMYLRARYELSFAEGDGWQAVELPFLGNRLSTLVIVPDAGSFPAFEATFDEERLDEITTALRSTPLDVSLPQFQFTSQLHLDDALSGMGLSSAFAVDQADFSGVTTDELLAISDVFTQTYVGVDEEGVEGEAATVIPRTPPGQFPATTVRVDRPFLFLIRDRSSGLVLQIGRVVDPTA